jgi:diketogulonate reductase-like aldo/keto reductase
MIPQIALNNGRTIPQLGFGTLSVQPDRQDTAANADVTARIVDDALQIGYRHLDTAQQYGTERASARRSLRLACVESRCSSRASLPTPITGPTTCGAPSTKRSKS